MGLTGSCFGIGATMSNFLGQVAVQYLGHVASLVGSFALSFVSLGIFGMFMPETLGRRNENGININNILAGFDEGTSGDFTRMKGPGFC